MREDLISSAVAFLKDPQVNDSPLTKKIEFIESKGLTQEEVQEALRRANGDASTAVALLSPVPVLGGAVPPALEYPVQYYHPPALPERDWKDYFIMATTSVGVAYGLYQVMTRYVLPSVVPTSKLAVEEDKEAINEEFLKIDAVLKEMNEAREKESALAQEKFGALDDLSTRIEGFLTTSSEAHSQQKDDIKLVKLELDNLKALVTQGIDLQNAKVDGELEAIKNELQLLKQLVMLRQKSEAQGEGLLASVSRKVPLAASIPSAKDILGDELRKKAAKAEAAVKEEAAAPAIEPAKEEPALDVAEDDGIPAWQKALASRAAPGIPAWQQAAGSS